MAEKKKEGWPSLGSIRKGQYGSYVKINDNVTILVDGKEVKLNDKRIVQLQSPVDKVENMIKAGVIDESKAESARAKAQENSSWLKYDMVIPPPRN